MDEPEFIELCRVAKRLAPQQRDQLSNWLMEDKLTELSTEYDNALRIFDYASFDIENGPFSNIKTRD